MEPDYSYHELYNPDKQPRNFARICSIRRLLLALLSLFRFSLPMMGSEPGWVTGITEPFQDVTMSFTVVGILANRPPPEGASVKRGEVVAELDSKLEMLDVERKRRTRDQLKSEADRLKVLFEQKTISVSQEERDKKEVEYEVARVEYEIAMAIVERHKLASPVDGYVVQYFRAVGEKCDEQRPVVRVVDVSQCYFTAFIEPRLLSGLALDREVNVEIETPTLPLIVSARISYIAPVVDASSGLLRIRAKIDNHEERFRPGVPARMRLP